MKYAVVSLFCLPNMKVVNCFTDYLPPASQHLTSTDTP